MKHTPLRRFATLILAAGLSLVVAVDGYCADDNLNIIFTTTSAGGVFDFGYAEGGEQQMVELLYHLLEVAASWGRNELSICLDPEDDLYPFLPATARAGVVFRFLAAGIPVPSARDIGRIYLDPAYL